MKSTRKHFYKKQNKKRIKNRNRKREVHKYDEKQTKQEKSLISLGLIA